METLAGICGLDERKKRSPFRAATAAGALCKAFPLPHRPERFNKPAFIEVCLRERMHRGASPPARNE